MTGIRATLIADGTSDQALVNVLQWIFSALTLNAQIKYADLRTLIKRPVGLLERAQRALDLYPADLLFVHRDAEAEPSANRYREISDALANEAFPYVPVVPVRMTEAWFLFDESAIRLAAGNPNGKCGLSLPAVDRLETLPDPKAVLRAALLEASELPTRRRQRFQTNTAFQRLAELIDDYAALRALESFRQLEEATRRACNDLAQGRADAR